MPLLSNREAELFNTLKQLGRGAEAKAATADIFHLARQATAGREYSKAAINYAALAQFMPRNQNLPMRAARSYQKADQLQDAARWYLEAAERYAKMHQTTQAIATLRLYREVAPDEHNGPKHIFNLCREKGATASGLFEFLSAKEQAIHKLRAEDIFSAFDDNTFDAALDTISIRHLKRGEILTRTGEPAQSIFIIVHGRVEGFLTLKNNHTHLGYLGKGDICSAVPYFTGGRRTSEISATEPTDVLELPYAMLDQLREKSPEFSAHLDALYRAHILATQLALAPVFSKLDAAIRQDMIRHMTLETVKAGALLFCEGDRSCDVYLVRSGSVAINLNINGQERQFKTMQTGALVGEISVATKGKRSASARAISDCQLVKLGGDKYQHLFDHNAALQLVLEQRKKQQARETQKFVRQLNLIEGDDTCELLLRDIWGG